MLKFLLVIAVVVLVLWALRRPSLPPPPRRPGPPPQLEPMVRCSHCGVHLPRSEAVTGPDGHLYCSPAHRAAGPRRS